MRRGKGLHQLRVGDLAEVVRQIRVDHLLVARVQQPMNALHGIQRATARSIGILFRTQVRFENRRQHQRRRRLRYPIPDTRDTQRSVLTGLLLRNQDPPDRLRPVGLLLQVPRQFPKPPVHPIRFDVRYRLAVHPGGAAVTAHLLPGGGQHIGAPHLVAQRVESEAGSFLRFGM